MLLHAMSRWPGIIDEHFWSFAFKLAVHQHNHLPARKQATNPFEAFTMTDDSFRPQDDHVFGCPTYVLDPALADGSPRSKWASRCYIGVYVGVSTVHASNVAIVYNPATGLTSPVYHCLFDEEFTTVSNAAVMFMSRISSGKGMALFTPKSPAHGPAKPRPAADSTALRS